MLKNLKESKQTGTFTLAPDKDVYGELTIDGKNTSLYLQDNDFFNTRSIQDECIKGILQDLTKVTLLECIIPPLPGSVSRGEQSFYFANVFPHYVIHGDHHIHPTEKNITSVNFVIDDATTLFYDFDAFGSLRDAHPFIKQIAHANGLDREITIGPNPQILYYTGKGEIFAAETVLGKISASHRPSYNPEGPDGVSLKNTIFVAIDFKDLSTFEETISRTLTLLRYLEMLVGRPQNLLRLNISIESDDERSASLQVHMSHPPRRKTSGEGERPYPSDVLLDAVQAPEACSQVLANWLERQEDWHNARMRFSNSFAKQQHYDIDRLIGAANMFDILPSYALPQEIMFSDELKEAKKECINIFKKLSNKDERKRTLDSLGKISKKSSLKYIIRHRCQKINQQVGERFPELDTVTDEAVNCRNYYVHGKGRKSPPFDYSNNPAARAFFTNTLEFVFAASDLIEAGWDIKVWIKKGAMSHPFALYHVNYAQCLEKLKSLLSKKKRTHEEKR